MILSKSDPFAQFVDPEVFLTLFATFEGELKALVGELGEKNISEVIAVAMRFHPSLRRYNIDIRDIVRLKHFMSNGNELIGRALPTTDAFDKLTFLVEMARDLNRPLVSFLKTEAPTVFKMDASLTEVLNYMVRNDFCQVPVRNAAGVLDVLTQRDIAKWLGKMVFAGEAVIDVRSHYVSDVLGIVERPSSEKFKVVRSDFTLGHVENVLIAAMQGSYDNACCVLITSNGGYTGTLLGMLTASDLRQLGTAIVRDVSLDLLPLGV